MSIIKHLGKLASEAGYKGSYELFDNIRWWIWKEHKIWSEVFVDDDQTFGYLVTQFIPEGRADSPIKRRLENPDEANILGLIKSLEIILNGNTSD